MENKEFYLPKQNKQVSVAIMWLESDSNNILPSISKDVTVNKNGENGLIQNTSIPFSSAVAIAVSEEIIKLSYSATILNVKGPTESETVSFTNRVTLILNAGIVHIWAIASIVQL